MKNQTEKTFDFGPSFISAKINDKPYKLITGEERIKKIKSLQSQDRFLSLAGAALSSFSYSTYKSDGFSGVGHSPFASTSSARGVSKGFSIPNFQGAQNSNQPFYHSELERVRFHSLKLQTLPPQAETAGVIYLAAIGNQLKEQQNVFLELTALVDEETHKFLIEIKKEHKK